MALALRVRRGSGVAEVVAGIVATAAVHAGLVMAALELRRPAVPSPPVYAVELVAAPVVPTPVAAPEAVPPPKAVEPPAPPRPAAKPVKAAEVPAPVPPKAPVKVEAAPKTSAPVAPVPGEAGTGADVATVKTPGLEFPFPEYLRNILNQVYRRWDATKVPLRAEISFLIMRDGSVRNIQFMQRSGNFSFDLEAQGAIEAAGNARAFGPLPEKWPADVLPVSFVFEPRGGR